MIAAAAFTAILWFGLLTMRVEARWPLAAFQIALFVLAAVVLARRRFEIRPNLIGLLLASVALYGVIQMALGVSVDFQRTLDNTLGWAANCAAFSLSLSLCRDRRFLKAQVWFALGLSIAAVIFLFTDGVLGPFVYRNQFAAYVESVLGIAIAFAILDRRAVLWMLIAAALLAAVVAGASRTGTILCLAELIVIPLVAFWQRRIPGKRLLQVGTLAVASAAVLGSITGWESVWKRLQEPNPYSLRADLLQSSVAMLRDRPITGFGLGAWPAAYPGYARYDDGSYVNQAHNDWAQWAVEGGVPLLAMMLMIALLLVRPALHTLWGIGVLAVFAHAFVDYPFQQRPALAAFLFAMAAQVARATSLSEPRPRAERAPASSPSETSLPAG